MNELERATLLAQQAGVLRERLDRLSYAKLDSIGFGDLEKYQTEFLPLHALSWRAFKRYARREINRHYLQRKHNDRHPR